MLSESGFFSKIEEIFQKREIMTSKREIMTSKNEPFAKKSKTDFSSDQLNKTFDESFSMDGLKHIFIKFGINYSLPDEHDFLTTENMFNDLPMKLNSIFAYQLSEKLSLSIGTIILTKPLNLPNGFITPDDADKLGFHLRTNLGKQSGIENIYFVTVNLKIYVLIESTLFPHWRWKSLMTPYQKWRNGCRIVNPIGKTTIIWLCSLNNLGDVIRLICTTKLMNI